VLGYEQALAVDTPDGPAIAKVTLAPPSRLEGLSLRPRTEDS
jgi:hypothetical protein